MKKREELVFPARIIASGGDIDGIDNLLSKRELAITFSPRNVTVLKATKDSRPFVVLDFGKELQGALRISVARSSATNMRVRITLGESVTEAMSSVGEKNATNDHSPRDFEAITSNMGISDFGRSGFRFARVELLDEGVMTLDGIAALLRTEDIERRGFIRTNDERFNEILDTAIYTAFLCAQDGVIYDGIKRDRIIWSGDLNSEILTLAYAYGNVPNVKRSLRILMEATPRDEWMNTIPSYSAWWLINICDYYMLSADVDFMGECADYANNILQNLDKCISDEGVIDFSKNGTPTSLPFYLDWPSYSTGDAYPGVLYLLLYAAKKLLATPYKAFDKALARSISEKLSRAKRPELSMKQTTALRSLVLGGTDGDRAFLENGGARGFNTFMSYFILKAESLLGCENVLGDAKQFYGGMLDRGATTFWEDFSLDWLENSGRIDAITPEGVLDIHADFGAFCYKGLRHSLCHGWSSGIVAWAIEEIVGLKILEPGFRKVSINPNLLTLTSLDARIPTPVGDISIKIKVGEEPVITLPEGVELEG